MNKIEKMTRITTKQLLSYPYSTSRKTTLKKYVKNILSGQIFFWKFDRYSWPNTLLALGLLTTKKNDDAVRRYCENFMNVRKRMRYLDNAMIGLPLLYLYVKTDEERYLCECHRIYIYLKNHKKDARGSLVYRESGDEVLVDMLGMVCPFLTKYSQAANNPDAMRLAETQILNFIKYGMDSRSGLPYHGYNCHDKVGIIGWGRAVGWLLMGLRGYIENGGKNEMIKQFYDSFALAVLRHQDDAGAIHWQLEALDGMRDTSATAMIFANIDKIKHQGAVELAEDYLLSKFQPDGIGECSAECGGVGIYPQKYGCYPWSLGPTLELASRRRQRG